MVWFGLKTGFGRTHLFSKAKKQNKRQPGRKVETMFTKSVCVHGRKISPQEFSNLNYFHDIMHSLFNIVIDYVKNGGNGKAVDLEISDRIINGKLA